MKNTMAMSSLGQEIFEVHEFMKYIVSFILNAAIKVALIAAIIIIVIIILDWAYATICKKLPKLGMAIRAIICIPVVLTYLLVCIFRGASALWKKYKYWEDHQYDFPEEEEDDN